MNDTLQRSASAWRPRAGAPCGALALALLLCAPVLAQTASVGGRVLDPGGDAIPGAVVTMTSDQTNAVQTTTSNGEGIYAFPSVSLGSHTISATANGFKQFRHESVPVQTADNITLDLSLELGEVSETVTVVASALTINRSDSTVETVVDRQFVENLPMNGRSFHNLIVLTPGVVQTPANNWNPGQFSVNGQRTGSNYFTVDGVSANFGAQSGYWNSLGDDGALPAVSAAGGTNSLVSIDAMQEFKIQTSTYAPEFGRQPGGQIQITTRSGTNSWNLTLFDYLRNDVMDANDWFANRDGLPRPALRQNDFGGVLGGPVVLPGYDGRDRTFFFVSYEGLRLRQPQFELGAYPTAESRAEAPATVQPLLNSYPIPTGKEFGDGTAEFSATYSNPSQLDATSIRIDHRFGSKLMLFGRYNYAPSLTAYRGGQPYYGEVPLNIITTAFTDNEMLTLGSTHVISPSMTNEARFSFGRSHAGQGTRMDDFGGAEVFPESYFFPSFANPEGAAVGVIIGGWGSGYTAPALGSIADRLQTQYNVVNNFSWVSGRHQWKLGADYRRLTPEFGFPPYSLDIEFDDIGAMLSGNPSYYYAQQQIPQRLGITNLSFYAQDTWRASRRLTLTYGLRWEINPAPKGLDDQPIWAIDQIDDLFTTALAPLGDPLFRTQYGNFAPRIGIAYQLGSRTGSETMLRAGVGIFYDIPQGTVYMAGRNGPYSSWIWEPAAEFPIPDAAAAVPPFDPASEAGRSIETYDPNFRLPLVRHFNLAIEQALGRNRSLTVTYAGAQGRRLSRLINPGFPNGSGRHFDRINLYLSDAQSSYNSLQAQFLQRLTGGLQLMLSHVWAHSIDDGSQLFTSSVTKEGLAIPSPRANRGDSDFDVRHIFNGAVTYEIPGVRVAGIAPLIRNWAVDSTLRLQTPLPVDVADWGWTEFGSFDYRPDVVQGQPLYLTGDQYPGGRAFNREAFNYPEILTNGTLGRNSMRAFPLRQVDLAIRRRFILGERLQLQFRAELFNVLNTPNFAAPEAYGVGPYFGVSTQMFGRGLGGGGGNGGLNPLYQSGGPRSAQLALKLVF